MWGESKKLKGGTRARSSAMMAVEFSQYVGLFCSAPALLLVFYAQKLAWECKIYRNKGFTSTGLKTRTAK
jgi:hypothetical protein